MNGRLHCACVMCLFLPSLVFAQSENGEQPAPVGPTPVAPDRLEASVNSAPRPEEASAAMGFQPTPLRTYRGIPLYAVDPNYPIVEDASGNRFIYHDDLLPHPVDSNDLQVQPLLDKSSLGPAYRPQLGVLGPRAKTAAPASDSFFLRLGLQARPGVFYDTGYAGGGQTFNPRNIAVDGSAAAHQRGQITFSQFNDGLRNLPLRMQLDTQTLNLLGLDSGRAQAYLDLYTLDNGDVTARNVYANFVSNQENGFLIGKAETAFGDMGSVAVSTPTFTLPVGAVAVAGTTLTVPQLRYTRWLGEGWSTTFSMEDPSTVSSDIVLPGGNTILHRWPVLTGRARYVGENGWDTYQLSGLIRRVGFENDATSQEFFATGWGISGTARFRNEERTDAMFLGGVVGQGIGGYIFGTPTGAKFADVAVPASFDVLKNIGAFAALNHIWYRTEDDHSLSSNFGYGYVLGETLTKSDNRKLQQAWCNLLWDATANSAYGLEYQYGMRTDGAGKSGDDHRLMFVIQVGTGSTSAGRQVADNTPKASLMERATTDRMPLPATTPTYSSPRLKYRL